VSVGGGAWRASDEELDEAIDDAIFRFDAERLHVLLVTFGVDPNRRIGLGEIPLLHLALDAETDRGIGEPGYVPAGSCFSVLLDAGGDPRSIHLGQSVIQKVGTWRGLSGLRVLLEQAGWSAADEQ
jgi:hypothetical protein